MSPHTLLTRALRIAIAILAFAAQAGAASDRWTSVGPAGGLLEAIAIDPAAPGVIYVGGFNAGIYRSADGGESWTAIGPRNERIFSIAVDPRRGILYGGTQSALVRSRDRGATWEVVDRITVPWPHPDGEPPAFLAYQAVAIRFDPALPSRVYVAAFNDVFISDDGGESFTGVQTPFFQITSFAQSTASPGLLFAGTQGAPYEGIYRSTDGARTWKQVFSISTRVNAIVCDPTDAAVAYAATDNALVKTTDGGETWSLIGDSPGSNVISDVILDPSDPRRILVPYGRSGVRESRDKGATWVSWELGDRVFAAKLAIGDAGQILAATDSGVLRRDASGTTWTQSSRGLNATLLTCLSADDASATLFAGTFVDQIRRSSDAGASWQRILLPEPADSAYEIAIDPVDTRNVFARSNAGILRSTDGGRSWLFSFPTAVGPKALRMSPTDPKTLYFASGPFFEDRSQLYGTTNGGLDWTLLADLPFDVGTLAADPRNPLLLYAGVVPNGIGSLPAPFGGLFKSVDGGKSWSSSNGGLDPADLPWFTRIAIDPSNSSILYAAATWSGVFKSTDGGANWRPIGGPLGGHDVLSIAVHPRNTSLVIAGTSDGLYVSFDSGERWRTMNEGLDGSDWVTEILFRPGTETVRVSTNGGGVYERDISTRAEVTTPSRSRRPPVEHLPR